MPATRDKRVDAYIASAAPFARPILAHLRALVHRAVPDIEETMRWGFPHFDHDGIVCSMAAFTTHCAVGFWKASLMSDPRGILRPVGKTAMGHLGRITRLDDLPPTRALTAYVKEAARLNADGVTNSTRPRTPRAQPTVPTYLKAALKKNPKASTTFERFSPSQQREYVDWLTDAKTEATRSKRLATTILWLTEGKVRNWQYVRA